MRPAGYDGFSWDDIDREAVREDYYRRRRAGERFPAKATAQAFGLELRIVDKIINRMW